MALCPRTAHQRPGVSASKSLRFLQWLPTWLPESIFDQLVQVVPALFPQVKLGGPRTVGRVQCWPRTAGRVQLAAYSLAAYSLAAYRTRTCGPHARHAEVGKRDLGGIASLITRRNLHTSITSPPTLAWMTLTRKNKGSTARPPRNARKCGANVVHRARRRNTRGRFRPLAAPLPGLSLERTTGFEPATLTLAR